MTLDVTLRSRLSRFIDSELLDRLPESDAAADALRQLSGLQKAISSFLPLYIADDEELLNEDRGLLRPGTFLFADVSGFTALSELLQKHGGNEGAESLTHIINNFFSTMLEILAKSDGQLLKFAGDALLAFFPASGDSEEATKAIRTGLRMQRAMNQFQPIKSPELDRLLGEHSQQLSMSIGLSRGKLFEAVVGNVEQRDHVIQGGLPGMAMNAEGAGDQNDVIIDADLHALQTQHFDFEPLEDGFYRVIDNFGDNLDDYEFHIPARRRAKVAAMLDFDDGAVIDSLRAQLERVETVGRFMAPAVLNELVASPEQLPSFNRPDVVTMFMHVSGFATMLETWGDEGLTRVITILDRYYTIVQRVISEYGGNITRTDPYQFGFKMLITFGAPVANPDDAYRAVSAAVELHRKLERLNGSLFDELPADLYCGPAFITQRMGITLGPVFAGQVGWRARREYTVMGDDVNLAARLMSKAALGQALISQRVWERVRDQFDTDAIEPLVLKGKSAPVSAYIVKGYSTHAVGLPGASVTPFVGRDALMRQFRGAVRRSVETSQFNAIALQGEAGVGKTRVAAQIARYAEHHKFRVAWVTCALRSERKTTWATVVSQLLRIDRKGGSSARFALRTEFAKLELSPLEGVFTELLFDVVLPEQASAPAETPKTPTAPSGGIFNLASRIDTQDAKKSGVFGRASRQLESQQVERTQKSGKLYREMELRTSLDEAVAKFLCTYALQQPTLIVLDDLHRENPQALTMLKRVIESASAPMKLIVVLAYEPAALDTGVEPITLSDLSLDETTLMAVRHLSAADIAPELTTVVWERTKGRPLYIESLLETLCESDQIAVENGRAVLTANANVDALPDDVRKLIISRIDRLSALGQSALRAASVLGEDFTAEAIGAMLELNGRRERTPVLRELLNAQIVEEGVDGLFRFRHGMARAAVYESLPRIVRQKLHRQAAEYLTQTPDWERSLMVVAHHWISGGMPMSGIQLVNDAAEKAEADGQLERAIDLYTNALELFPTEKSWQTQIDRLQAQRKGV